MSRIQGKKSDAEVIIPAGTEDSNKISPAHEKNRAQMRSSRHSRRSRRTSLVSNRRGKKVPFRRFDKNLKRAMVTARSSRTLIIATEL